MHTLYLLMLPFGSTLVVHKKRKSSQLVQLVQLHMLYLLTQPILSLSVHGMPEVEIISVGMAGPGIFMYLSNVTWYMFSGMLVSFLHSTGQRRWSKLHTLYSLMLPAWSTSVAHQKWKSSQLVQLVQLHMLYLLTLPILSLSVHGMPEVEIISVGMAGPVSLCI
jgi:hypothetical protein